MSEQMNMNLSNDSGKKPFFLLQFYLFDCILNIVPIALIALEQPLRELFKNVFVFEMLKNSLLKISFPEN